MLDFREELKLARLLIRRARAYREDARRFNEIANDLEREAGEIYKRLPVELKDEDEGRSPRQENRWTRQR